MSEIEALTAQIVAGYCKQNHMQPDALPALIRTVYDSLLRLGTPIVIPEPRPAPAVPIRRSITNEHIICLECGYQGQMIRRHLLTRHQMTPERYRERWNLAADYPMLAHGYSEKRSALAKSIGLGLRGRGRAPEPAPEPPAPEPAPAPAPVRASRRKPAAPQETPPAAAKPASSRRRSRTKATAPPAG